MPQLCPSCALTVPQLCPRVFNFVPQLCLNCAITVAQRDCAWLDYQDAILTIEIQ